MEESDRWFGSIQQALASNDDESLKSLCSKTAHTIWDDIPPEYRPLTFLDQPGIGALTVSLWESLVYDHRAGERETLKSKLRAQIAQWNIIQPSSIQPTSIQPTTFPNLLYSTPSVSESNFSELVDSGDLVEGQTGLVNAMSGAMSIEATNLPAKRSNARTLRYIKGPLAQPPCEQCSESNRSCYQVKKSTVSVCWECKVSGKKCSLANAKSNRKQDTQAYDDSESVILETLKELQLEQKNLAISINQHIVTMGQNYICLLTNFQEATRHRTLIYDKLQTVEAWIASLRPPPGDLGPLTEQQVGDFYLQD